MPYIFYIYVKNSDNTLKNLYKINNDLFLVSTFTNIQSTCPDLEKLPVVPKLKNDYDNY